MELVEMAVLHAAAAAEVGMLTHYTHACCHARLIPTYLLSTYCEMRG